MPRIGRRLRTAMLLGLPLASIPAQVIAPVDGGRTTSLGQPRAWHWSTGASTAALNDAGPDGLNGQFRLGALHSIGNPVVQGLMFGFEGYAGGRDGAVEGGLRARLAMPIARFTAGLDWNARTGAVLPIYSMTQPIRRGGLALDGSVARIDFMPTLGRSVTVGVEIPLRRVVPTGRTRPARDRVTLEGPPARPVPLPDDRALRTALAEATASARLIGQLVVPFLGRDTYGSASAVPRVPPALLPLQAALNGPVTAGADAPRTVEREATRFHDLIDRAFGTALGADGRRVGDEARRILLTEVLIPYDRLLGQNRAPDSIRRFGFRAQGAFTRWLHAGGGVEGARAQALLGVFTALLEIVEENRAAIAEAWGDPRFAWLPLQYGLRPEQHDTQAELDAIVEQATRATFSEGNAVSYVINEQFQFWFNRTVHSARDYHVLVTHDFRGLDDIGDPDEVAFNQVVHGYLAAMTARVQEYDSTGTFPTYIILHDQWYYSLREAPLFLRLLEDPTRYEVRLPRSHRAWEDSLARAQDRLREAIEGSSLLQAQRRQYGDRWLRDLIKVHVTVTNRPDQTFWSWTLIPGLPIQDNMLRDHRKLVFYDVSEEDPSRGEALYTGAGIGEHYTNPGWEDRSLYVQGPALVGLKDAVRTLLVRHGFTEARIPYALRARPRSPRYGAIVDSLVRADPSRRRALGVHNGSGFLQKDVNVAKAVLYTLMPGGSVIIIPDSFWNSEFWGSALFGAALRGAKVLLIAPSYASNSVDVNGTKLLSRELLSRLLVATDAFAPHLELARGLLRIGVFDSRVPVPDLKGKVRAVSETFENEEWLRELFAFPPEVYAELGQMLERMPAYQRRPDELESDSTTKIHLKANLFASAEAWQMMTLPSWGTITWSFVEARRAQVIEGPLAFKFSEPVADPIIDAGASEIRKWLDGLPPATRERVVFYTIMGSQNQNYRSMLMDAEDALVVAGWPSVIPYLDAISLIGQSRWVTTQAELTRLLPPMGPWQTLMAHWARLAY